MTKDNTTKGPTTKDNDESASAGEPSVPDGTWQNWSGVHRVTPEHFAQPTSEAELCELLAKSSHRTVRVVGSGHSFVPLCLSDELLIDISKLTGIISVDPEKRQVTVWAGTRIWQLGEPLRLAGLAMTSMGDIDRQTLAGAISTGTHGTGLQTGSISTQVVGLRLILANGEVHDLSSASPDEQAEELRAAQVALGSLGVLSQVTLQCVDAFYLHERMWHEPFDDCLGRTEELLANNRHFEFFYSPVHRLCAAKALNAIDLADPSADLDLSDFERDPAGNVLPRQTPDWSSDDMVGRRIDWSHRVFPSARDQKFNEIEFALPAKAGPACLEDLRRLLHDEFPDVKWPLEYRYVAEDDLFLSPNNGRPSITISAHEDARLPHEPFFEAVEAIFRNHGARPHWGKWHTHGPDELKQLYPDWGLFHSVRQRLDPERRFLNPYLSRVFGDS